ncbi:hypothetical protein BH18ACT4_BH18ACT4_11610 [soil metagenome]
MTPDDVSRSGPAWVSDDDDIDADDEVDEVAPAGAYGGVGPDYYGDDAADADAAVEEAEAQVEADLDLAQVMAERNDYLDALRRLQADFENYKKQTIRRDTERVERAAEHLAERLLPVLDACDGALAHEESYTHVRPIYDTLMDALEKEGLGVVYPAGEPFDPNLHDAVMHEEGDDGDGQVVTAVLRTGYLWKGRVLRPAMVKVKG